MLGLILGLVAFVCVIVHIMGRCPLWVPVLILACIPLFVGLVDVLSP